jgi:uncharacterized membrane protein (UPF0127 family)
MRMSSLFLFLLLLLPLPALAAGFSQLSIQTAAGSKVAFTVEMAQTPEESERGLMNRPSLAADAGMLFDFGSEQRIAMWMKNTLIPLDMIFIAGDGHILGIAERTVPMSLEIIPSPGSVRAVLEINGGTASRLQIHPGDRVIHPIFGQ